MNDANKCSKCEAQGEKIFHMFWSSVTAAFVFFSCVFFSFCVFHFNSIVAIGCWALFLFSSSFTHSIARSPVLHLKISPFMFRVKTHIAFIINFWQEYMHGFFLWLLLLLRLLFYLIHSSTAWITVLRSDKQALCDVQVFFFSTLFWYSVFRLWFVKMVEWTWGRRERLISSNQQYSRFFFSSAMK